MCIVILSMGKVWVSEGGVGAEVLCVCSLLIALCVNALYLYTQQKKSSWALVKVQFSQKCFILGKFKTYYVKQVSALFILIPNLKESVDK